MTPKKEMLIAIDYLRRSPMNWLKQNWWKVAIIWLTIESFIRQFGIYKELNSFMKYVEMVIGAIN